MEDLQVAFLKSVFLGALQIRLLSELSSLLFSIIVVADCGVRGPLVLLLLGRCHRFVGCSEISLF